MSETGVAIFSHVYAEERERKKKAIFQEKQENEEVGEKKQVWNTR